MPWHRGLSKGVARQAFLARYFNIRSPNCLPSPLDHPQTTRQSMECVANSLTQHSWALIIDWGLYLQSPDDWCSGQTPNIHLSKEYGQTLLVVEAVIREWNLRCSFMEHGESRESKPPLTSEQLHRKNANPMPRFADREVKESGKMGAIVQQPQIDG